MYRPSIRVGISACRGSGVGDGAIRPDMCAEIFAARSGQRHYVDRVEMPSSAFALIEETAGLSSKQLGSAHRV